EEIGPHAEHLHQLHEGAAQLLRAGDHALRIPDVRGQQRLLGARRRLERPLDHLPQVAAADRGGELPDGEHPPRAARPDLRHPPSMRLMRVAAAAAPKPLSMFTTTTPEALLL